MWNNLKSLATNVSDFLDAADEETSNRIESIINLYYILDNRPKKDNNGINNYIIKIFR